MLGVGVLVKPASGLCNMHCDYCFYCDEAASRRQASYGFMTEETLKNVIRRAQAGEEITLAAIGGSGYYLYRTVNPPGSLPDRTVSARAQVPTPDSAGTRSP